MAARSPAAGGLRNASESTLKTLNAVIQLGLSFYGLRDGLTVARQQPLSRNVNAGSKASAKYANNRRWCLR